MVATRIITASTARGGVAFKTDTNSADISYQLVANSTSAAAANAAAITAALAAAAGTLSPIVSINVPGVYYIQQVIVPSNVSLSVGRGVIIRKDANYLPSMFINQGALQATPVRDSNIAFFGEGTLDGNASTQTTLTQAAASITANTFLYGVQGEVAMISVDNFTFKLRNVYNCNGFGIQWIGVGGLFEGLRPNTCRDFLHINGPSSHVLIRDCAGFSSDDFIALNAWDWHRSAPLVGDIQDVDIVDCAYYGTNNIDGASNRLGNFVKFLAGTRASGAGAGSGNVRNVRVNGFRVDASQGSASAAKNSILGFPADYDQIANEWAGTGSVSNVLIEGGDMKLFDSNMFGLSFDKNSGAGTADGQTNTTVRNVVVRNVHFDFSGATATAPKGCYFGSAYNTYSVSGVKFEDCEWTPSTSITAQQTFMQVASKTAVLEATINGLMINTANGSNLSPVVLLSQYSSGNAALIKDLTVARLKTAPGVQFLVPWLTASGGSADYVRVKDLAIVGSGSGNDNQGVHINSTTSTIGQLVFESCDFDATKCVVYADSAAAGTINALFRNCRLNNVTHPVFINTAATVDVTFNGCSINTGSNLARISNAAAAVTLSFIDTISSGTGATALNVTAAANVRVRNSDRIQLPAGLTATNPPTPQNNDLVNFAATPSYTGSNVVSGTGAGLYVYRGTGTVGWIKLN